MASLYLLWLCMCLASARCVGAANVCARVCAHIRCHLIRYYTRPVERMTCFNQCLGRPIRARALHPAPAHQVKPFWFLRASSMSVFLSSHHLGPCQVPPYPSMMLCSLVGLPLPSAPTDGIYLRWPQSILTPWEISRWDPPPEARSWREQQRERQEGGYSDSVAERECNTPKSWPLDRVCNQAMHKHSHTHILSLSLS